MEVEINASVPKLRESGRLRALRVMSRFGRISYRVLGFQGSNTVKSQIIARYLQAEEQSQGDARLAITPANYRFKLKGRRATDSRQDVYVFGLAPRKSSVGLFRGEIWLDAATYLPVLEKGRLAKSPSLFFKRVDFEREFSIQDGKAVPHSMNSTISTRIVGKVELNVNYSKYTSSEGDRDSGVSGTLTTLSSQ